MRETRSVKRIQELFLELSIAAAIFQRLRTIPGSSFDAFGHPSGRHRLSQLAGFILNLFEQRAALAAIPALAELALDFPGAPSTLPTLGNGA